MKFLPMFLVALVACGSCAHTPPQGHPDTRSQPAVAKLMAVEDDGDRRFVCTVWKLDDQLVATAGHCCEPDESYVLEGPHTTPGQEAKVVIDLYGEKEDSEVESRVKDVCVMRAHLTGAPVALADADPAIGERIWTLGYPKETFLISDGIWSGRGTDDGLGVCSSVTQGGASGSPILNSRNQAVGVLVRGFRTGDNITFVAPIEILRKAVRLAHAAKIED